MSEEEYDIIKDPENFRNISEDFAKERISITSEQVSLFSISLSSMEYSDDSHKPYIAGIFLSAMIDCSRERDFIVPVDISSIKSFGYRNRKNIKVIGGTGSFFCQGMKGGKVIVEGNAAGVVDNDEGMSGGTVIVKGDAIGNHPESGVGSNMTGGSIEIHGNVVQCAIGFMMKKGRIIVHGNHSNHDEGIGSGAEGGLITVFGNADSSVGNEASPVGNMKNYRIEIGGDAQSVNMDGGLVVVKGDVVEARIKGGELRVGGKIRSIKNENAKIFRKGRFVVLESKGSDEK